MISATNSSTYNSLNQLLTATDSLQNQVSTLQEQTTTGKVSQTYAGLAPVSSQVLALTAASAQATAYAQSITTAQGKATAMQNALTQIQSVVSGMAANAAGLGGSNSSASVTGVAQEAQQALQQVVSLLNTTYAGDYVFSGADTANPPVPGASDITSSGLYTQIGAQVSALATTPTSPAVATVISNTVSIASSTASGTTVFSSYLTGAGAGASPVQVQIAANEQVPLYLPANQNVAGTSDPSIAGTGSAISDIIRSLAVVANSTGAMASNPDFSTLMQNAATTLTSANQTLAEESGQIGISQDAITAAASANSTTQTALTSQLSNLTDVNAANTISELQNVSTQLEASYKVLSAANSLNLASYVNF